LGAKASPPTVDNDGNALLTGALYWNTSVNKMYVWSGSAWGEISSSAEMIAYKYTVAGGATSVSGADDNGLTLTYTVGKEQVYINGVLQVRGSDYTASTGSSITGISAMIASDIVTVLAFTSFSVSDTYTQAQADAKFFQTANAFLAGKNKIINGDFTINQRAFTSTTTSVTYGFDRWQLGAFDGTTTYSAQTFTAGAAPVAGYEATNYARVVTTGQTATNANSNLRQLIEDVRTFAGQTVTLSFWAQAGSGTPKIATEFTQTFGTTGSPSTAVNTYGGQVTLSTSWARYSVTVAIPSVSGTTITSNSSLTARLFVSAGSDFNSRTGSLGIQTNTFNIWGVQVEAGSIATPFQTATGTIQGELAACQRYYWRAGGAAAYQRFPATGSGASGTQVPITIYLPVNMRTSPSSLDYSTLGLHDNTNIFAVTSATINVASPQATTINLNVASGITTNRYYELLANNSTSAYVALSAEL
jgi:hypothetical protein